MNRLFVVSHLAPDRILPAGYSLLKVGSANFSAEFTDATGDQIAALNPFYSELTALYWIWKNYRCAPDTVVGMVHYRRFFGYPDVWSTIRKRVMSVTDVERQMTEHDMLIPQQRYFKEGLYGQYAKSHHAEDLDACLRYLKDAGWLTGALDHRFRTQKTGAICNMMVTRKSLLDEYCAWLFPMLFAVEPSLQLANRPPYQRRGMGFLSERLFNLWLWSKVELRLASFPILRIDKSSWSNLNNMRKYLTSNLRRQANPGGGNR